MKFASFRKPKPKTRWAVKPGVVIDLDFGGKPIRMVVVRTTVSNGIHATLEFEALEHYMERNRLRT